MMGIGLLYALILGQYATIFIGVVMLLIGPLIKGFGMGDTKIVAANQFFIGNVFGIPIALYLVIGGLFFRYMGKNPRVGPYFFAVLLNVFVAHTIISAGSV